MGSDNVFYDSFEKAAVNAVDCAKLLHDTLKIFPREININAGKIKQYEHAGDKVTHETVENLNKTFMTPIDREDIYHLVTKIDDIVDFMDAAVSRLALYKISSVTPEAIGLAEVLVKATELLKESISSMRNLKKPEAIIEKCHEVHTMENIGDQLLRTAMVNLFENSKDDAIMVIKWKEIYEDLECATDKCEDVANIIEGIILKNA